MNELTEEAAPLANRWAALAVLCLSLIVIAVDTTILNVALPSLVDALHASTTSLQWIVDAYTVVFAGLLLTAGSLGDRFGRRGALAVGLAIFAVASAASALASTPGQLIGLRALTGVGAAFVFPATLSILTNVFTDPVERQRAIAIWAGTAGIGIALGPVVGGLLLRHYSWSSVFWVNVPVCAIALIAGALFIPQSRDPRHLPIDVPGAVASIIGLSSLVYGIIEGPTRGWTSAVVLGAFGLAAVALGAFAVVELHRRHPMLDLRLFRNPRFSAASLAVAALYFCLFGTIFFQTQMLQFVLGYDPLGAGVRTVPFALILLVVANATPRLVRWAGTRNVITTGLALVALSMFERTLFDAHTGYDVILLSQSVFALGMGLTIAPATASIMGAVPPEHAGVGSAVNDTTRQVGGALGVAVMGSIGAALYRSTLTRELPAATALGPPSALNSFGATLATARQLPAAAGHALSETANRAFVHGFAVAHVVALGVAILGAVVASVFLPRGMRVGAEDTPSAEERDELVGVGASAVSGMEP